MATGEEAPEATEEKDNMEVLMEAADSGAVHLHYTNLDSKLQSNEEIKNVGKIISTVEGTLKIPEDQVLVEAPSEVSLLPEHSLNGPSSSLNGHIDKEDSISNEQMHEDSQKDEEQQVEAALDETSSSQSYRINKEVTNCSRHEESTIDDGSLLRHENEDPKKDDQQELEHNTMDNDTVQKEAPENDESVTQTVDAQQDHNQEPEKATEDTQPESKESIPSVEVVAEAPAGIQTPGEFNVDDCDANPDATYSTETDELTKTDVVHLDHKESLPEDKSVAEHADKAVKVEDQQSKQADAMDTEVKQEEIVKLEETGVQEEMSESEHVTDSTTDAQEVLNQEPAEETNAPVYEKAEETSLQTDMAAYEDHVATMEISSDVQHTHHVESEEVNCPGDAKDEESPNISNVASTEPAVEELPSKETADTQQNQESLEEIEATEAAMQQNSATFEEAIPEDHVAITELSSDAEHIHNMESKDCPGDAKYEESTNISNVVSAEPAVEENILLGEQTADIQPVPVLEQTAESTGTHGMDESSDETQSVVFNDLAQEDSIAAIEQEVTEIAEVKEFEEITHQGHDESSTAVTTEDDTTASEPHDDDIQQTLERNSVEAKNTETAEFHHEQPILTSKERQMEDNITVEGPVCASQEVDKVLSTEEIKENLAESIEEVPNVETVDEADEEINELRTDDIAEKHTQELDPEETNTEPVQTEEASDQRQTLLNDSAQEDNIPISEKQQMKSALQIKETEATNIEAIAQESISCISEEPSPEDCITTITREISDQSNMDFAGESAQENNILESEPIATIQSALELESEEKKTELVEENETSHEMHAALFQLPTQEDNSTPGDLHVEEITEVGNTEATEAQATSHQSNAAQSEDKATEENINASEPQIPEPQSVDEANDIEATEPQSVSQQCIISNSEEPVLEEPQEFICSTSDELTPTEEKKPVTEPGCDDEDVKPEEPEESAQESNAITEPTADIQQMQDLGSTEETKGIQAVETEDHQQHGIAMLEEPAIGSETIVDDQQMHDKLAPVKDDEEATAEEVLAEETSELGNDTVSCVQPARQIELSGDSEDVQTYEPEDVKDCEEVKTDEPEESAQESNALTETSANIQQVQELGSTEETKDIQAVETEDQQHHDIATLEEPAICSGTILDDQQMHKDKPAPVKDDEVAIAEEVFKESNVSTADNVAEETSEQGDDSVSYDQPAQNIESSRDSEDVKTEEPEEVKDSQEVKTDEPKELAQESNTLTEPTADIQQVQDLCPTVETKGIEAMETEDHQQHGVATLEAPAIFSDTIVDDQQMHDDKPAAVKDDEATLAEEVFKESNVSTLDNVAEETSEPGGDPDSYVQPAQKIELSRDSEDVKIDEPEDVKDSEDVKTDEPEESAEESNALTEPATGIQQVQELGSEEETKGIEAVEAEDPQHGIATLEEPAICSDTIVDGQQMHEDKPAAVKDNASTRAEEVFMESNVSTPDNVAEETSELRSDPDSYVQPAQQIDLSGDRDDNQLVKAEETSGGSKVITQEINTDDKVASKMDPSVNSKQEHEQNSVEEIKGVDATEAEEDFHTSQCDELDKPASESNIATTELDIQQVNDFEATEEMKGVEAIDDGDISYEQIEIANPEDPSPTDNETTPEDNPVESNEANIGNEIDSAKLVHEIKDEIHISAERKDDTCGSDETAVATQKIDNTTDKDAVQSSGEGRLEKSNNIDQIKEEPKSGELLKERGTAEASRALLENDPQALEYVTEKDDVIKNSEQTSDQDSMPLGDVAAVQPQPCESSVEDEALQKINLDQQEKEDEEIESQKEEISHQGHAESSTEHSTEDDTTASEPHADDIQQTLEQDSVEAKDTETAEIHHEQPILSSEEGQVEDNITIEGPVRAGQEVDKVLSTEEIKENLAESIEVPNVETVDEADEETNELRTDDIAEKHTQELDPEETNTEPVQTEEASDQRHTLLNDSAQEDNTPASEKQQMESALQIKETEATNIEAIAQESISCISESSPEDCITTITREISDQSNMDFAGESAQENNILESEPIGSAPHADIQPVLEEESVEDMQHTNTTENPEEPQEFICSTSDELSPTEEKITVTEPACDSEDVKPDEPEEPKQESNAPTEPTAGIQQVQDLGSTEETKGIEAVETEGQQQHSIPMLEEPVIGSDTIVDDQQMHEEKLAAVKDDEAAIAEKFLKESNVSTPDNVADETSELRNDPVSNVQLEQKIELSGDSEDVKTYESEDVKDSQEVKTDESEESAQETNALTEPTDDIQHVQDPVSTEETKGIEAMETEDHQQQDIAMFEELAIGSETIVDDRQIHEDRPAAIKDDEATIAVEVFKESNVSTVDKVAEETNELGSDPDSYVQPAQQIELSRDSEDVKTFEPQDVKDSEDVKTDEPEESAQEINALTEPTADIQQVQELGSTEETKGIEAVGTEDHQQHGVATLEAPATCSDTIVDDQQMHEDKPAAVKDDEAALAEEVFEESNVSTLDNVAEETSEPGGDPDSYVQQAQQIELSRDSEDVKIDEPEDVKDSEDVNTDEPEESAQQSNALTEPAAGIQQVQELGSTEETKGIEAVETEDLQQHDIATLEEPAICSDTIVDDQQMHEDKPAAVKDDEATIAEEVFMESNVSTTDNVAEETSELGSDPDSYVQPAQQIDLSGDRDDNQLVKAEETSGGSKVIIQEINTDDNVASKMDSSVNSKQEHEQNSVEEIKGVDATEAEEDFHTSQCDELDKPASESNIATTELDIQQVNDFEATEEMKGVEAINDGDISYEQIEIANPEDPSPTDNETTPEENPAESNEANIGNEIDSAKLVHEIKDEIHISAERKDDTCGSDETAVATQNSDNTTDEDAVQSSGEDRLEKSNNIDQIKEEPKSGELLKERGTAEASQALLENDPQALEDITEKDDVIKNGEQTNDQDSIPLGDVAAVEPQPCESSVEDEAIQKISLDRQQKEDEEIESQKEEPQEDEEKHEGKKDDVTKELLVEPQNIENGVTNRTEGADAFEAEQTQEVVTEIHRNEQALDASNESTTNTIHMRGEGITGTDEGAEEENRPQNTTALDADAKNNNKVEKDNAENDEFSANDSTDKLGEATDEITNKELEPGLASSVEEISDSAPSCGEMDPIAVPQNIESGVHIEDKESINKVDDDKLAIQESEKEIVAEVDENKETQNDNAAQHDESQTKSEDEGTSQLHSNEPYNADTEMDDTTIHSAEIVHDTTSIQPREIEEIGENKGFNSISKPAEETSEQNDMEQELSIHHKVEDEKLATTEHNAIQIEAMQQKIDSSDADTNNDNQLSTSNFLPEHETESADDMQPELKENAFDKIDETVSNEKTETSNTAANETATSNDDIYDKATGEDGSLSDDDTRSLDVSSVVAASKEDGMNETIDENKLDLPAHSTEDKNVAEQGFCLEEVQREMPLSEKPLPTEPEGQEENQIPKEQDEEDMHKPEFVDSQKEVEQDLPVSHFLMNLILGKDNSDANSNSEPEAERKQEEAKGDNSCVIISKHEEILVSLPIENKVDEKLTFEENDDVKFPEETNEMIKNQSRDLKLDTERSLKTDDAELSKNTHDLEAPAYKNNSQDNISELLSEVAAAVATKTEARDIEIPNIGLDDRAVDTVCQGNMEATTQIGNGSLKTNLDDLKNTKASEEDTLGEGQTGLLPESLPEDGSADAVSEQTLMLTESGMTDAKSLPREAVSVQNPACAKQDETIESSNTGATSTYEIQQDGEEVEKTKKKPHATTAAGDVAEEHAEEIQLESDEADKTEDKPRATTTANEVAEEHVEKAQLEAEEGDKTEEKPHATPAAGEVTDKDAEKIQLESDEVDKTEEKPQEATAADEVAEEHVEKIQLQSEEVVKTEEKPHATSAADEVAEEHVEKIQLESEEVDKTEEKPHATTDAGGPTLEHVEKIQLESEEVDKTEEKPDATTAAGEVAEEHAEKIQLESDEVDKTEDKPPATTAADEVAEEHVEKVQIEAEGDKTEEKPHASPAAGEVADKDAEKVQLESDEVDKTEEKPQVTTAADEVAEEHVEKIQLQSEEVVETEEKLYATSAADAEEHVEKIQLESEEVDRTEEKAHASTAAGGPTEEHVEKIQLESEEVDQTEEKPHETTAAGEVAEENEEISHDNLEKSTISEVASDEQAPQITGPVSETALHLVHEEEISEGSYSTCKDEKESSNFSIKEVDSCQTTVESSADGPNMEVYQDKQAEVAGNQTVREPEKIGESDLQKHQETSNEKNSPKPNDGDQQFFVTRETLMKEENVREPVESHTQTVKTKSNEQDKFFDSKVQDRDLNVASPKEASEAEENFVDVAKSEFSTEYSTDEEQSPKADADEKIYDEMTKNKDETKNLADEVAVKTETQGAGEKVAHKKRNLWSGVGSKVKRQLAKVKKAIVGKPGNTKRESPKS
ncbi:hypothetical protein ACP4OV_009578 [Aristida adscensionis]